MAFLNVEVQKTLSIDGEIGNSKVDLQLFEDCCLTKMFPPCGSASKYIGVLLARLESDSRPLALDLNEAGSIVNL